MIPLQTEERIIAIVPRESPPPPIDLARSDEASRSATSERHHGIHEAVHPWGAAGFPASWGKGSPVFDDGDIAWTAACGFAYAPWTPVGSSGPWSRRL
ncbi:hypothetical protein ColLi_06861 [Colletotrichum liriopes]|uniref:Uncharacterized protein n=1 Tax=Colletotrichum liriopes TaxID=708192 RepID=A0AA37GPT0_9PEZI|nr:hypothetical protein ColLi_06861 [Colletotrichum liriopes]